MTAVEPITPELMSADDSRSLTQMAYYAFLARYRVKTTRDGYARSLRRWFAWCDQHFIDPLHAERKHIELWSRQLEEIDGLKIRTVAAYQNALAGFYRLAHADGLIDRDPMTHVLRPKLERVSPREGMTRSEFNDLLIAAETAGPRDHALVMVLGYCGLRISEALSFDVERLERHRGQIVAPLNRKGGKTQDIALPPGTGFAVEQLIATLGRTAGPVFVTRTGARMDKAAAGRVVHRLAKAAGIRKNITPHSLRHTFVTLNRANGTPDHEIQAATGHADLRMVSYYDRGSKFEAARRATMALETYVERAR